MTCGGYETVAAREGVTSGSGFIIGVAALASAFWSGLTELGDFDGDGDFFACAKTFL